MLRRQREIRTQVQKLLDATLFAVSLWLAHVLRSGNETLAKFGGTPEIQPFKDYAWLLLIIIPITPFLLEMNGFYQRPLLTSRRRTAWQLVQACVVAVVTVIVVMFLFRQLGLLARGVIILFGMISFGLVMLKEELLLR